MSWGQALQPIMKVVPRVKAGISLNKSGGAKILVSLSDTMFRDMGSPKALNVLPGLGENAGRIMTTPNKDGAIAVTPLKKGGARFWIPIFEGIPGSHGFDVMACELVSFDTKTKAAVAALPVQAWREAIDAARGEEKSAKAEAAAPPAGEKIDIEEYLRKKGHRVMRMSAKLFQIDGHRASLAEALNIANGHRRKAELKELGASDVE